MCRALDRGLPRPPSCEPSSAGASLVRVSHLASNAVPDMSAGAPKMVSQGDQRRQTTVTHVETRLEKRGRGDTMAAGGDRRGPWLEILSGSKHILYSGS